MAYPKLTPITATGATAPRYLGDRFADIVNVKDFGAVGDGVADDTAAFTAAQNSGAPAVMVPNGTYKITEDVAGTFFSFGEITTTGGGDVEIIDILTIDTDTTYSPATQNVDGLMSASDKEKLDGINTSAGMYTLKAEWPKPSNGAQKTLTNCIIGKPLIVVHKPLSTIDSDVWCDIKVISGAINATDDTYHHNKIGIGESSCFVCIPTETTVVFSIWNGQEYDCLYAYD